MVIERSKYVDIADAKDYSVGSEDECDLCGKKPVIAVGIKHYQSYDEPEDNDFLCEECLKKEKKNTIDYLNHENLK